MVQAARWYREAIEASADDPSSLSELRYDLAEVLLQSGDNEGALSMFRDVLRADPTFRDVRGRVSELETHLEG
jgi:thioredoxin-like negative regulator of GroEL